MTKEQEYIIEKLRHLAIIKRPNALTALQEIIVAYKVNQSEIIDWESIKERFGIKYG